MQLIMISDVAAVKTSTKPGDGHERSLAAPWWFRPSLPTGRVGGFDNVDRSCRRDQSAGFTAWGCRPWLTIGRVGGSAVNNSSRQPSPVSGGGGEWGRLTPIRKIVPRSRTGGDLPGVRQNVPGQYVPDKMSRTKCPATKCPSDEISQRQNVPRQNVPRQKVPTIKCPNDKMSQCENLQNLNA